MCVFLQLVIPKWFLHPREALEFFGKNGVKLLMSLSFLMAFTVCG